MVAVVSMRASSLDLELGNMETGWSAGHFPSLSELVTRTSWNNQGPRQVLVNDQRKKPASTSRENSDVLTLAVEQVPIEKLVPNERNPRNNDDAVDAVARSIQAYGFNNPIVTDGDLRIAAGHTRLKAAEKLGLKTVPVIRVPGLVGSKFSGFAIADNKTAEIAEWDPELLNKLVSELNLEVDFDLSSLGFDDMELTKILDWDKAEEREDEAPPVPDVPITEPGDLWLLGDHRLLCGDATKSEHLHALMDGHEIDCLVTDPPYGVSYGALSVWKRIGNVWICDAAAPVVDQRKLVS